MQVAAPDLEVGAANREVDGHARGRHAAAAAVLEAGRTVRVAIAVLDGIGHAIRAAIHAVKGRMQAMAEEERGQA